MSYLVCFALTIAVLRGVWWLFFEPRQDGRVMRALTGIDALDRKQMVKDPPPLPRDGIDAIDIHLYDKRRN